MPRSRTLKEIQTNKPVEKGTVPLERGRGGEKAGVHHHEARQGHRGDDQRPGTGLLESVDRGGEDSVQVGLEEGPEGDGGEEEPAEERELQVREVLLERLERPRSQGLLRGEQEVEEAGGKLQARQVRHSFVHIAEPDQANSLLRRAFPTLPASPGNRGGAD